MPQKAANSRPESKRALLASILTMIVLLPLGYSVVRGVITQGAEATEVFLEPAQPPEPIDKCIWGMDPEQMRLHHWEHLRKIREDVVRYGNRKQDGLNKCKDCHKSRVRFCDRCHNAVNLTPDCWGCHDYE